MVKLKPKYLWRFRDNVYAAANRKTKVLLTEKLAKGILIERNHFVGTGGSILSGFKTTVRVAPKEFQEVNG